MNFMQNLGQLQGLGGLGMGGGPKPLIEFKAGRMNFDGRMVKPDRRKGIIRVTQDAEGMKQFQWCDADTKNPIESFYVFPDDVKFEKVKQSKDRVYLLEFKSTQQRHFYWMQETDQVKDEEYAKKVHNILNNIQTGNSAQATGPQGPQMTSQQPPQPGAPGQQSQFQNLMQDDQVMAQLLQAMSQQQQQVKSPGLSQILTSDALLKLIEEDSGVRLDLLEHLPEGQRSDDGLRENLLSPQFRQALDTLNQAVFSEQISLILSSLGLDPSVLNNCKDGMEALINALIRKYSNKQ